jgi:hypothetical protein
MRPVILDEEGESYSLKFICTFNPLERSVVSNGVEQPLVYMIANGALGTRFAYYKFSDSEVSFYEILDENSS